MSKQHQQFVEAYARFVEANVGSTRKREPELELVLLKGRAAYDTVKECNDLTSESLREIVSAASHPRAKVWYLGMEWLGELSEQFDNAARAIREMFGDRKSHVRFNALCSLRTHTLLSDVDSLLRAGLSDKSYRVRWKAAEKALRFVKKELVPELTAALASETNKVAHGEIELVLCLLRDGYQLTRISQGYLVSVRYRNGIRSYPISEEQLHVKGIEAIVAELHEAIAAELSRCSSNSTYFGTEISIGIEQRGT